MPISTTSSTNTSTSSGCSMSPLDDSDASIIHPHCQRGLDYCNTHLSPDHFLSYSSTSTNCHGREDTPSIYPEDVSSATRVQLEMIELDQQLARIRLRCRNLTANVADTLAVTASTIAATETTSSLSSTCANTSADLSFPSTPPRRAVVPRMGVRRHCSNSQFKYPVKDITQDVHHSELDVENSTKVSAPDKTSTAFQLDSASVVLFCDDIQTTTHACGDPVQNFQITGLDEPKNTVPATDAIIPDTALTPPPYSGNPTCPVSPISRNTAPVNEIGSVLKIPARNHSKTVSKNPLSVDTVWCYESESSYLGDRSSSTSATNWPLGLTDRYQTPETAKVGKSTRASPHQLRSSFRSAATSPKDDRKMNPTRNGLATNRKLLRYRETVPGNVDRSSQTDDADADRRRRSQRQELYRQYADVMYTNPDNLQHTIAVQQALFRQQVDDPDERQPRGAADSFSSKRTNPAMEWVAKRRADGTRYITRRPAKCRRGWRADRRRTAEQRRRRHQVDSTTDDGRSQCEAGRCWTKTDRLRQVTCDSL